MDMDEDQQPSSSRRPPLRAVSNLQREEALFSSSPAKSAQAGQSSPRLNIAPSSDAPVRMQAPSSDFPLPTSPFIRNVASGLQDLGSPLHYPTSSPHHRRRTPQRAPASIDPLFSQSSAGQPPFSAPRFRRGDVTPSSRHHIFNPSSARSIDPLTSDHATPSSDPQGVENRTVIWGTTVNIQEAMASFKRFIMNFTVEFKIQKLREMNAEEGELTAEELLFREKTVTEQDSRPFYPDLLHQMRAADRTSMNLDCLNLKIFPASVKLYYQLIRYPQEIIPLMDYALTEIYTEIFAEELGDGVMMTVRPFNANRMTNMRDLDPADIDQLVTIKGLMIRCSPVIPDLKEAFFRCAVCDQTATADIDRGRIIEPTLCPRDECKSKNTMVLIHNRCVFADKQICKMQETPDETPDGQTPYTVSLCTYDDLVDVAKPGDRVEVTGIFRAIPVRVNPRQRTIKSLFRTYVDIVHIKKTDFRRLTVDKSILNENEFETNFEEGDRMHFDDADEERILELSRRLNLYNLLSRSVAPSIFGMEDVKKGVLLQLFGGTNKFQGGSAGSPRIRGDINILLVGDPGVSKSQLLKYVNALAPRGVYTSGKGSSAVGLTAYITRDPDTRQLVLESGALVLSDGGICCIDEFDKMSDQTRSVLHEVMEQQTISVAKAGIITTLNARTSILASANPINSKFDESLSVVANVNLPPPLVSRFDLLYLLLDRPNEREDRLLAMHIVGLYLKDRPVENEFEYVPLDLFTKYISYAKNKVQPVISEEAGNELVKLYTAMRQRGRGSYGRENVITATTRQLESMIRLSEAHARMRLSERVEVQDVEEAHRLTMTALQAAATDPSTGKLDLDLLQTGMSSRDRIHQRDQRIALAALVNDMRGPSMKFSEAFRLFKAQSDERIGEDEFLKMLREMTDENVVVTGRGKGDTVIRRKV